jgi:hypothetical protein
MSIVKKVLYSANKSVIYFFNHEKFQYFSCKIIFAFLIYLCASPLDIWFEPKSIIDEQKHINIYIYISNLKKADFIF